MNKCIILILVLIAVFVDPHPYNECLLQIKSGGFLETDSGIDAFTHIYNNLNFLTNYVDEIFNLVIESFKDTNILPPEEWCTKMYKHGHLMNGGYRGSGRILTSELSSFEAFEYSYRSTTNDITYRKNEKSHEYFTYIFEMYEPVLRTQLIRNPIEYCSGQLAKGPPSDYAGLYVDHTVSNKHMHVQYQGGNQNKGEGSSRVYNVAFDYEGQEIDLNTSYFNGEDIDENQS